MKICDRCGALYLARFERRTIFETRTVVLEAERCHCGTVYEEMAGDPGNSLRELTEPERANLHDWLARYSEHPPEPVWCVNSCGCDGRNRAADCSAAPNGCRRCHR